MKAFDRLHLVAMNRASDGSSLKKHGISAEQLEVKKQPDMPYAITRELFNRLLAEAKERGLLK